MGLFGFFRKSPGKENILKAHLIDVLKPYIGTQITGFLYHDVTTADELSTNNNGIDIIAQQVELKFADNSPLFVSWANVEGWSMYSLALSNNSFGEQSESFVKDDDNWKGVLGHILEGFQIYGYKASSEPHLLVLEFSGGIKFGIANFYSEEDFIPKSSVGDDIWIIFGMNNLIACIAAVNLEHLE